LEGLALQSPVESVAAAEVPSDVARAAAGDARAPQVPLGRQEAPKTDETVPVQKGSRLLINNFEPRR